MPEPTDRPWHRDELVLVLDLYLKEKEHPDARRVPAMSRELCALPIHSPETRPFNFRSADAVGMMLARFAAIDMRKPTARSISQTALDVWAEFTQESGFGRDRQRLWTAVRDVRERYGSAPGDAASPAAP